MPKKCGMKIEKAEGTGNPGDEPVSEWYHVYSSTGEPGDGLLYYKAEGSSEGDEYCIEYSGGADKSAASMRMPPVDGESPDYYCYSHTGAGEITVRVIRGKKPE